jgi:hypothetical protein
MKQLMSVAWIGGLAVCASWGCAATQVRTDHDPTAALSQYRTFALKQGKIVNEGIVGPDDALMRDRINEAVKQQLSRKGLRPTNLDPDLIVTFMAGERTQREIMSYWGTSNWADQYWSTGAWGDAYWPDETGSKATKYGSNMESLQTILVVDLIDAKTKKVVWRSTARADGEDFRQPQNIEKAVDKAFKKFPATRAVS